MLIPHKHTLYSKITDFIYIGTNQCCLQKRFAKKLLKEGIKADISLEERRIDAPFGVKYYLWLPVKDQTAPNPLQVKIGVAMIEELVKAKKKVYIHCEKGHGRAPTLVIAYLMAKGIELKEAIKFVKSKRPGIYIHPNQMKALRKFEKNIKIKMIKMQIVTSPGCECCEDVKKYVEGVKKDFPNLKVNIFDVTTSQGEDLVKKYNILAAPGIIINGRIEFTGETKEEDLRKKLTEIQKKK